MVADPTPYPFDSDSLIPPFRPDIIKRFIFLAGDFIWYGKTYP